MSCICDSLAFSSFAVNGVGIVDRVNEEEMLDVGDDSAELRAGGSSLGGERGSGRDRGEGGRGIVKGGGKSAEPASQQYSAG